MKLTDSLKSEKQYYNRARESNFKETAGRNTNREIRHKLRCNYVDKNMRFKSHRQTSSQLDHNPNNIFLTKETMIVVFLTSTKICGWVMQICIVQWLDVCLTVFHQLNDVHNQQDATTFSFINLLNQPCMFRAKNSPILRSTFCLYLQLLVQCTDTAADRCIPRLRWNSVPTGALYQKL